MFEVLCWLIFLKVQIYIELPKCARKNDTFRNEKSVKARILLILGCKILCFEVFGVILHAEFFSLHLGMTVETTIHGIKSALTRARARKYTIGLVPTMGALHEGHASLISRSLTENDVTVVSIFVNPTQFNDSNDLTNYPRTLDADIALIEDLIHQQQGKQIYVFAPTVEEIYPTPDTRIFSYPPIDTVMEGARRPGHFNGVCQIVSKLFSYTEPDRAYFGEKDFQQIAVIRAMVKDMGFPLELVPCPIVRERSGLALSSRNSLLSEAERNVAVNISRALMGSVAYSKSHSVAETETWTAETLNAIKGLEVEYYEIVDAITLQKVTSWDDAESIQGCITVFCNLNDSASHRQGTVRLIDNINYK